MVQITVETIYTMGTALRTGDQTPGTTVYKTAKF